MNKSFNLSNNGQQMDTNINHLSSVFDKEDIQGQATHFLSNLIYALRKFKYLILACIIFFTVFGWYDTAKKPILYRSQLTMLNEPDLNAGASANESARFLVYLTQHYYQTQFEILASKKLAEKVALRIIDENIEVPAQATTHLKQSPFYEWMGKAEEFIQGIVTSVSTTFRGSEIEVAIDQTSSSSNNNQDQIINRYTNLIKSGLQTRGGDKSQLLTLSFVSTDRVFASTILNLIAEVYQDFIYESKQQVNQVTAQWLVNQLERAKLELLDSENKLLDFQKKVQLTDASSYEDQNNANLNELSRQYTLAKLNYDELIARYGSKHPQARKAYSTLASLQAELDKNSISRLDNKDVVYDLVKLENEVETNRELYLNYLSRFKGFNITGNQNINTVKVLDKAEPAGAPFSPNLRKGITLWCLFGTFFGIVFSLLLSFLDRTYKTVDDIEHKLRLPVLGQLPFLSNKVLSALITGKKQIANPEIYYSANSKSIFSEAINHIRTNILFSNFDQQPQTILITSSIQAEGKTTVASNLAFSLSKIDKTILIDADLRKPRIASVFESEQNDNSKAGLVDFLAGLSSFEESTYKHSTFEKLTILPSGTIPPNPQELLASDRFNQFLEEIKSKYKYIVIDTAPVLPVSDSIVLGKLVDVVLVAVKAGSTTIKMTRETIKRLNIANVNPTGLVLTQLDKPNKAYGKHGLNYYYSYYGNEVKKQS